MDISNREYKEMVKKASPPSHKGQNGVRAFLTGGLICALGQALGEAYRALGIAEENAKLLVTLTLIALTAVLTALGVFDAVAKVAGAGTFVPVTGFANAVVAPAMEFASEGHVLGTAAQMFRIAGPVLVYGCTLSSMYGFFYWLFR